ncbi:MAG TPA: NAD-dependent succinate-semialdehyde dehydrogenase [Candidatus Bathyarchaeia archaeon]|nr:NAD-dependent succinate-semialdehyde dehydrogenase [Candidatus Bathyarchaeia archaeon]
MAAKKAKRWIETVNPANGKVLRRFRASTRTDVEKSVEKARKAFEKWRELSPAKRAEFLQRAAKILRSRKEKLGRTMTLEMGKTIKESVPEVAKCAWALEYFAENGPRFLNPEAAKTDASDSYMAFEPLGVIGSIMPWNFPLWQCVRFAAPSLMVGNTAVFKPSSVTPQSGLELEEVFDSTGVPPGTFNVVLGSSEVASYLIEANTTAISFTGSVPAGQDVAEQASSRLKKVVLELGGSDPFIVLDDADVEAASTGAVAGRFINNGQSCICAKRFFVARKIADEFLDRFTSKTKSLKVGDPLSPETDVGPLVREESLHKLDRQVKDSIKMGAKVQLGGERLKRKGFFYAPTILTEVEPAMPVMKEETFGPAAPVMIVKDDDEAVRYANNSEFGLGSSVWSRDIRRAEKVARQIAAGMVTVNNIVVSDPRMPFGGVKESGIGRELSRYGMLEFTNIKSIRLYEKSPLAFVHVE